MTAMKRDIQNNWVFEKIDMVKENGHLIGTDKLGRVIYEYMKYRITAIATTRGLRVVMLATPGLNRYEINREQTRATLL